jgi:hypothetical protein
MHNLLRVRISERLRSPWNDSLELIPWLLKRLQTRALLHLLGLSWHHSTHIVSHVTCTWGGGGCLKAYEIRTEYWGANMLYLHFTNHANQPEFIYWKNFPIALQKIWYLDDFVKLCTCFKGSLTRDFRVHVFSWISFSWAPEFPIGAIAYFLRKFAEIHLATYNIPMFTIHRMRCT